MAFVGELKVRMTIDEDVLAASVSSSLDQLGELKKGVKGVEDIANSISFRDLEQRLSLVGQAGVAAFADISKAGEDFETALLRVNTIANLSDTDLKDLGESVKDIGSNIGLAVDPTKALASEYEVLSSGFTKTADASKVLESALKLSAAGNAEAGDTTRVLTAILNAYGESADKAALRADQLFQTVNIGVTTVPELSQSLGRVVSVASVAGVSFEELSGAIALATQRGQTTSAAIDGLSGILNSFIKPTKEAQKAMADLKIEINAETLKQDGLAGTLEKINVAAKGNQAALNAIVGTHAAAATSATLLRDNGEGLRVSIDQITNSAGANNKAIAELSKGTEEAGKKLETSFQLLKISASEAFLPLKKGAVEALTGIVQIAEKTPQSLKLAALAFTALGTAVSLSTAFLIGARLALVPLKAELVLLGSAVVPRLTFAYAALNIPLGTALKLFVAKTLAMTRNIAVAAVAAASNFTLSGAFAALGASISGCLAPAAILNTTLGITAGIFAGIAIAAAVAITAYTDLENQVTKANQALIDSDNLQKKGKKTQGNVSFSTTKILTSNVRDLAKEGLTKDTVTQRILDEQRGATQLRNSGASDAQVKTALDRARRLKQIRIDLEKEQEKIKKEDADFRNAPAGAEVVPEPTKAEAREIKKQQKEQEREKKKAEREAERARKKEAREEAAATKAELREQKHLDTEEKRRAREVEKTLKKQERDRERARKKEEREEEKKRKKEEREAEKVFKKTTKEGEKARKEAEKEEEKAKKKKEKDKKKKEKDDTGDQDSEEKKSAFEFEKGSRLLNRKEFSGGVMSVAEFAAESNKDFGNNPFQSRLTNEDAKIISETTAASADSKTKKEQGMHEALYKIGEAVKAIKVSVPVNVNIDGQNVAKGESVGAAHEIAELETYNADFVLGEP